MPNHFTNEESRTYQQFSRVKKKKKSTETNSKITYVWELVDKDFMPAVTTLLRDVKENMLVMNKKIENISKGVETTKLNQM